MQQCIWQMAMSGVHGIYWLWEDPKKLNKIVGICCVCYDTAHRESMSIISNMALFVWHLQGLWWETCSSQFMHQMSSQRVRKVCCISRPQGDCIVLLVFALSVMTLLMGPSITIKCQEVMFSRQYQDQNSNLWTWRGPSRPTLNYFCQTKFHLTYLLKCMSHLLLLVLISHC